MTQKTYFTSDLHLSHFNVIKYCNRPYGNDGEVFNPDITLERKTEIVNQMNEDIVEKWNSVVNPYDFVYILGDVSFGSAESTEALIKRLNGIKILVYGNHDKVIRNTPSIRDLFSETHEFLERDFRIDSLGKKVKITMCHYPLRVWNKSHHGSWNLHGHSHGSLPPEGRQLDVGIDCNNMMVFSLDQVASIMSTRSSHIPDHHNTRE